MNESLFRPESIEAFEQRWLGQVSLASPVSKYILSICLIGLVTLSIAFSAVFSYTSRVVVNGVLLPNSGLIDIRSQMTGRVKKINYSDGDLVTKGDVLALISNERTSSVNNKKSNLDQLLTLEKETKEQKISLKRYYEDSLTILKNKSSALIEDKNNVNQQLNTYKNLLEKSAVALLIYKKSIKSGLMSKVSYIDKELQFKQMELAYSQLKRESSKLKVEILNTEEKIKTAEQDFGKSILEVNRLLHELRSNISESDIILNETILAPVSGAVTMVELSQGQSVIKDQIMFRIIPEGSHLIVTAKVTDNAIGFIEIGKNVNLRIKAFPYIKYGLLSAKVTHISDAPSPDFKGDSTEYYMVHLSISDDAHWASRLKAGMKLEAVIQLEERLLIEWIFSKI